MDDATLSTKIKRYFEVGSAVGGLAARLVGQEYLGRPIDDEAYAKNLKATLGSMKGPLMKVAQFLATIPDAIPADYAQELRELQSCAPAMGVPFVRRRMVAELGVNWQHHFQHFDLTAKAAASLGQMHQASTISGELVACKLQYPQMQSLVETDLANLRALLGVYHLWNKALDTSEVQDEIKTRLLEELDYHHEAKQIHLYQTIFQGADWVKVPTVHPDLSTDRLLTMSWMDGKPIYDFIEADEDFRNQLADRLFQAWYHPLYHHGVIHGDPHPGNYLVGEGGTIQLLDFGCVRHFPAQFVQGILHLYDALLNNRPDEAVYAYECLGFKNLSKAVIEVIGQWARLLYDPLLDDRVRPIQDDFSGTKGWQTATQVHAELNKLGGIRPPREFVFMDRAAVGMGGVFMRLRVERNWHQLFEDVIERSPFRG
ncbi:AarF/ABC1/UbiB kinase family protein [Candidatus Finniella inopinata]|uniref:AarF/ABC1/UbiB kinase family protein n=1 Tax=Candidatus Finniella inopinata TaxID=1696036 RepID=A0A4Q7DL02_9PROT|nr:AarF/ABC1/UbiB kinase family protein [Candidatus Finniella inopinata]